MIDAEGVERAIGRFEQETGVDFFFGIVGASFGTPGMARKELCRFIAQQVNDGDGSHVGYLAHVATGNFIAMLNGALARGQHFTFTATETEFRLTLRPMEPGQEPHYKPLPPTF